MEIWKQPPGVFYRGVSTSYVEWKKGSSPTNLNAMQTARRCVFYWKLRFKLFLCSGGWISLGAEHTGKRDLTCLHQSCEWTAQASHAEQQCACAAVALRTMLRSNQHVPIARKKGLQLLWVILFLTWEDGDSCFCFIISWFRREALKKASSIENLNLNLSRNIRFLSFWQINSIFHSNPCLVCADEAGQISKCSATKGLKTKYLRA